MISWKYGGGADVCRIMPASKIEVKSQMFHKWADRISCFLSCFLLLCKAWAPIALVLFSPAKDFCTLCKVM